MNSVAQNLEAQLDADLEQVWQDESPMTAAATDAAEDVDGNLDTRHSDLAS